MNKGANDFNEVLRHLCVDVIEQQRREKKNDSCFEKVFCSHRGDLWDKDMVPVRAARQDNATIEITWL